MKIIEAMKKIEDLQRKRDDLRELIHHHHCDYDFEEPKYKDQHAKVQGWLQADYDIGQEIMGLRIAIQKTNLATQVDIQLNGSPVTKSVAEWIYRRRELASADLRTWEKLNDKGLKPEVSVKTTTGDEKEIKIRRYYNVEEKDKKVDLFRSEPKMIDGRLEVINAITDLVE